MVYNMGWFDLLKQFTLEHNKKRLAQLENQFNNPKKAIGYLPIVWAEGIENEIRSLASSLGLKYKMYDAKGRPRREDGNSFGNGGHFMWRAEDVEQVLDKTEFQDVQSLIDFIAYNSYVNKPYRRVIDGLFGTPNVVLGCER